MAPLFDTEDLLKSMISHTSLIGDKKNWMLRGSRIKYTMTHDKFIN